MTRGGGGNWLYGVRTIHYIDVYYRHFSGGKEENHSLPVIICKSDELSRTGTLKYIYLGYPYIHI